MIINLCIWCIIFVNLHKYCNLIHFKKQLTSVLWRNMSKDYCYKRLFHFWLRIVNCLQISTWLCDKECACIPQPVRYAVGKTWRIYPVLPLKGCWVVNV